MQERPTLTLSAVDLQGGVGEGGGGAGHSATNVISALSEDGEDSRRRIRSDLVVQWWTVAES